MPCEQQVAPDHPFPPHCPHILAQLSVGGALVEAGGAVVVLKVVLSGADVIDELLPPVPWMSLMNWMSLGPTCWAMNWSPWALGCTPSLASSMALVKPLAREQSAMTMGDCEVVCCWTQPGMALLRASIVASDQLVGINLSI